MLQQQVAFLEHREEVGVLRIREHVDRLRRRIPQRVEPRQIDEPHHDAQIQRPRNDIDVVGADVELIAEQRDELVRRVGADLEPDDVAAPPVAQLALDQLELRAAAFVVELQLGVARQADDRGFENRLAREEAGQVRRDDLFEQDEAERLRAPRVAPGG